MPPFGFFLLLFRFCFFLLFLGFCFFLFLFRSGFFLMLLVDFHGFRSGYPNFVSEDSCVVAGWGRAV